MIHKKSEKVRGSNCFCLTLFEILKLAYANSIILAKNSVQKTLSAFSGLQKKKADGFELSPISSGEYYEKMCLRCELSFYYSTKNNNKHRAKTVGK